MNFDPAVPQVFESNPQTITAMQYDGTVERAKAITAWVSKMIGHKWEMGEDDCTGDWCLYVFDEHDGRLQVGKGMWVAIKPGASDDVLRMRTWKDDNFRRTWDVNA